MNTGRRFFVAINFLSLLLLAEGWVSPTPILKSGKSSALSSAAGNNVVLSPSTDSDAFDSFKVGSAKVHRYSKENDPDSETEYVMWYHGRSKDFDDGNSLPPLSTGRIGRATSRNGLHWEKDLEGSASEDITGVSLGLNKESWWGFDTAHVGLGSVLLPMTTPAVLTEGGIYLMYFMGGSLEETPVGDYLETVPDSMKDAKIKGMKMKIGVAVSQDGVAWGRVEGDDPTGACMVPYDPKDPNLEVKGPMRDDDGSLLNIEEELYCGWPEVVVQLEKGSEKKDNPKRSGFLMYYSTMTRENNEKCIALATSADGFRWFKKGVCVRPGSADELDAGGCARCSVLRNGVYNEDTKSWSDTDMWTMYYEGVSKEDNKHRIMWAESSDGRKWEKRGVALDVGQSDDAWDIAGVGAPHIIRMDDGTQRMYYTGQGKDGSTAVGVAVLADAKSEWKREQTAVTFA